MSFLESPDFYKPDGAPPEGEGFFEDARGFIQRIDKNGHEVNLLTTKAGFMRSGDVHKNTQFDFIFSGKVEVWLRVDDKDEKKIYEQNALVEIPAGIPHLFNFLEDTFMAEWWDGKFETWYYRPYRQIIEKGL